MPHDTFRRIARYCERCNYEELETALEKNPRILGNFNRKNIKEIIGLVIDFNQDIERVLKTINVLIRKYPDKKWINPESIAAISGFLNSQLANSKTNKTDEKNKVDFKSILEITETVFDNKRHGHQIIQYMFDKESKVIHDAVHQIAHYPNSKEAQEILSNDIKEDQDYPALNRDVGSIIFNMICDEKAPKSSVSKVSIEQLQQSDNKNMIKK